MTINVEQVRLIMARREMTNKQLAEGCSTARQNISAILKRGTCEPKTAGRIAKALGVDVTEIIKQ